MLRAIRAALPGSVTVEGPGALSADRSGLVAPTAEARARARALLELLPRTGMELFAPGQADFAVLPPDEIGRLAEQGGLRLIGTDLAGSTPGRTRYLPYFAAPAGDRWVAVLALAGPGRSRAELEASPVVPAKEAVDAALAMFREAHGEPALVVVLTGALPHVIKGWLRDLPGDVWLVPSQQRREVRVQRDGERLIVRSDPLGRALARLDASLGGMTPATDPAAGLALAAYSAAEHRWLAARDPGGTPKPVRGRDGVERVDPRTDPLRATEAKIAAKRERRRALAALPADRRVLSSDLLALPEDVVEDADIAAAIAAFDRAWLGRVQASSLEPAPGGAYGGLDRCTECHPAQVAAWAHSEHASAHQDLILRGAQRSPECLRCHSTGWAVPGGFVDPDDKSLLNVQCEACHGPMAAHADSGARPGLRPLPSRPIDAATCLECHDEANSPAFDYATYKPRAVHGGM
jgi:hypothetical protein